MDPIGPTRDARPISLRRSLLFLVMVCVGPAIALSGFIAYDSYSLYRQQIYSETLRLADGVIADVDRDLAGIESGLKVLATSEVLRRGDLKQFHEVAKEAVKSQIIYNYVLTNRDGVQLLNTFVPYGQALPTTGTPPQIALVFTEGKPVLTDYFIGPVTGKPAIAMGVPVFGANGEVIYSLNIGLAPDRLSELLKRRAVDDQWLLDLIDRSGTLVGRTQDEKKYVGTKIVPEVFRNISEHGSGVMEGANQDGVVMGVAYASSKLWGWSVAVGVPKELIEARLRKSFLFIGLITSLILVAGGWVVFSIIRNLTNSVDVLNQAALNIGSGKPVDLPPIQLAEAEAIGQALVLASKLTSEVHFRAFHDGLTNLANRSLFFQFLDNSLARSRRNGDAFSLLLIDLDHFKAVNDLEGHAAGDVVLKVVAQRIGAEIRAEDLAARLGGDEFAVLLSNSGREGASDVARRLGVSLAAPYENFKTRISASTGVVTWRPGIADGAAMLELADKALYRVKGQGGNAFLEAPM
jgi:diguanylate cyclase (GGDEF)-like protein